MSRCTHASILGGRRAVVFFRFSEDGLLYTVERVVYSTRGPRLGGSQGQLKPSLALRGLAHLGKRQCFLIPTKQSCA